MTDAALSEAPSTGPIRTTRWASRAGIGAGIAALLGTWGTGFGLWAFPIGFLFVGLAVILSLIALLVGLYALIKGRGSSVPRGGLWLGLLGAVVVGLAHGSAQAPPRR